MSSALESPAKDGSEVWSTVRGTLAEIRAQRLAWEQEVNALFDEFDSIAVRAAMESAAIQSAQRSAEVSQATEPPPWEAMRRGHEELAVQHRTSVQELAEMRHLIEQQTELLTAFVGAATQWPPSVAAPQVRGTPSKGGDPVISSVQAQFAQLRQSPASGSSAVRRPAPPKATAG